MQHLEAPIHFVLFGGLMTSNGSGSAQVLIDRGGLKIIPNQRASRVYRTPELIACKGLIDLVQIRLSLPSQSLWLYGYQGKRIYALTFASRDRAFLEGRLRSAKLKYRYSTSLVRPQGRPSPPVAR